MSTESTFGMFLADERGQQGTEVASLTSKVHAIKMDIGTSISQIGGILAHQRVLSNEKLCRMLLVALKSLHAAILYQVDESKENARKLIGSSYGTLVDLLLVQLFNKHVSKFQIRADSWPRCRRWALRIMATMIELLPDNYTDQEERTQQLLNNLIIPLEKDLEVEGAIKNEAEAILRREEIALVARVLYRLVADREDRERPVHTLPSDEADRLIKVLALPLACKYVTYSPLRNQVDKTKEVVHFEEFCFSSILKRELDGESDISDAFACSAHTSTMCLLVGLLEAACDSEQETLRHPAQPFYERVYRVMKSHQLGGSTQHSDSEQRELLVNLLVVLRFELKVPRSSWLKVASFNHVVIGPLYERSDGWLRARLFMIKDRLSSLDRLKEQDKLALDSGKFSIGHLEGYLTSDLGRCELKVLCDKYSTFAKRAAAEFKITRVLRGQLGKLRRRRRKKLEPQNLVIANEEVTAWVNKWRQETKA